MNRDKLIQIRRLSGENHVCERQKLVLYVFFDLMARYGRSMSFKVI